MYLKILFYDKINYFMCIDLYYKFKNFNILPILIVGTGQKSFIPSLFTATSNKSPVLDSLRMNIKVAVLSIPCA